MSVYRTIGPLVNVAFYRNVTFFRNFWRICWTYSDSYSCYFVFDKLDGIKVIAKVYVILDHPSIKLVNLQACKA